MNKKSNRHAAHRARPKAAKLETPKRKPPAPPKNKSDRPAAPINLTGRHMENSESSVIDFVSRVMPKIDEKLVSWHEEDRRPIRDAVIAGLEAAYAESARIEQAKEAPEYDPEIEARRADYERLAEALAFMTEMSGNRRWYDLDIEIAGIDTGDPRNGLQLIGAIHDHLLALWDHLDWHDAHTLRRFYVELRLHADQGAIERRRAYEEFQKEEARKEAP